MNQKSKTTSEAQAQPKAFATVLRNARLIPATSAILLCAILLGTIEYFLWGRTHLEDGIPLMLLLLLAAYDNFRSPIESSTNRTARIVGWLLLLPAIALLFTARGSSIQTFGRPDFIPVLCRNSAIAFIALAFTLRSDGFHALLRFLPLHILAIVVIPLYEYLLLEFSYPLRLVSTAASVFIIRLFGITISYDGTNMLWNTHTISITDACSGISLLGLLFLVAYMVIRGIHADAWKKWCWCSLVILWVILGNALRLLLTFVLYNAFGEKVFEKNPHLLLGCFFVVSTSLLIWLSSFLFQLDKSEEGKT